MIARWTCPNCHITVWAHTDYPIHCICGYTQMSFEMGMGDYVALGLHKIGITKRRVTRLKIRLGLKPCRCLKRQAALNRLGRKVGL